MNKAHDEYSDYIDLWLSELQSRKNEHEEPMLEGQTVNFIKLACEQLSQDNHVFIMACDILSKYIKIKNSRKEAVKNKVLLIISIINILSKHIGEISDLRPKYVQSFYKRTTGDDISLRRIKFEEMEILNVLEHRLPLFSCIDDLKILFNIIVEPMNLRVNLMLLCEELLCLAYLNRRDLHFEMKSIYKSNELALNAFYSVAANKLFLPAGIIAAAVKLTLVKNFLNLKELLMKLSDLSDIHYDHLKFLVVKLEQLVKRSVK